MEWKCDTKRDRASDVKAQPRHPWVSIPMFPSARCMAGNGNVLSERKSIRLWEPYPVSGRGKDGKEQAQAKSPINPVTSEEPKRLKGSGQKGMWIGCEAFHSSHQWSVHPPGERGVPPPSHLADHERGNPHALSQDKDTRKGAPQAQEVEEVGGSEGRPVMGRIVAYATPERGLTSDWSSR